jgi:uncharacterized protein
MQAKTSSLKTPRGFAKIPVLFHLGGISDNLATNPYFYKIIDIADLL